MPLVSRQDFNCTRSISDLLIYSIYMVTHEKYMTLTILKIRLKQYNKIINNIQQLRNQPTTIKTKPGLMTKPVFKAIWKDTRFAYMHILLPSLPRSASMWLVFTVVVDCICRPHKLPISLQRISLNPFNENIIQYHSYSILSFTVFLWIEFATLKYQIDLPCKIGN